MVDFSTDSQFRNWLLNITPDLTIRLSQRIYLRALPSIVHLEAAFSLEHKRLLLNRFRLAFSFDPRVGSARFNAAQAAYSKVALGKARVLKYTDLAVDFFRAFSGGDFTEALEIDCLVLEHDKSIKAFTDLELWPHNRISEERLANYEVLFLNTVSSLGSNWEIWRRLYDEFYLGQTKTLNDAFVRHVAQKEEAFWERDPDVVMAEIVDLVLPEIPDQTAGVTFGIDEAQRISVLNSGKLDESEFAQIEGIREVLLEALDDLSNACAGSNAFSFIYPVTDKYTSILRQDLNQLSIDKLFAYGLRLRNANSRLQDEIARGDLPEQGGRIGEAMDSVIALHGVIVLSTKRGQELSSIQLKDLKSESEIQKYKLAAQNFAKSLQDKATSPLNEEAKDVLQAANQDIGAGDLPNLSTQIAETTNANLLSAIGRIIVTHAGAIGMFVANTTTLVVMNTSQGQFLAQAGMDAAQAGVQAGMDILRQCTAYILDNWSVLKPLIACSSIDLTWLEALYAWLKRREQR